MLFESNIEKGARVGDGGGGVRCREEVGVNVNFHQMSPHDSLTVVRMAYMLLYILSGEGVLQFT